MRFTFPLLLLLTTISACLVKRQAGSEPIAPSKSEASSIPSYRLANETPVCGRNNDGSLIYVQNEQMLKLCSQGKWVDALIKGLQGEKGERGDTGAQSGAAPGTASAPADDEAIFRRDAASNLMSVVHIVATYQTASGKSSAFAGTGFVVRNGIIATNGHVATLSRAITVDGVSETGTLTRMDVLFPDANGQLQSSNSRKATRVDLRYYRFKIDASGATVPDDDLHDLALVEVDTIHRTPLVLSSRDEAPNQVDISKGVVIQEAVMAIGYSGNSYYPHVVTGHINAIQNTKTMGLGTLIGMNNILYESDMVLGGGGSGSPVLDKKGEVIGIYFAGKNATEEAKFEYIIQVKPLRTLIATHDESHWQALP